MFGVAVAMNGFLYIKLNAIFRILFMAAGLLLLVPGLVTDISGLVLLAALTVFARSRRGKGTGSDEPPVSLA